MKKQSPEVNRIYVCHTYYHVLVSVLKELTPGSGLTGDASIILSKMSNDFETLGERLKKSGIFKDVFEFDEKRDTFFPELAKYKEDKGNIAFNMINRIIYTKKFAKLEAPYVPVDMRQYDGIYVFCDSDPIGTYLNQNRIRYHALEDGLDFLTLFIKAKHDNRTCFAIKKFFSLKLNLIFICDGYSKYCIDMEVNNVAGLDDDFYKYKEVSRKKLLESLDEEGRKKLIEIFIRDMDTLREFIRNDKRHGILILTEPLCTLDVRERIFRDLTSEYSKEGMVFLKPHPRDELDYNKLFSDYYIFDRTIPMELLGLVDGLHFKKVVSVYTPLELVNFVDEKVSLGNDFMDKYEDPSVHNHLKIDRSNE